MFSYVQYASKRHFPVQLPGSQPAAGAQPDGPRTKSPKPPLTPPSSHSQPGLRPRCQPPHQLHPRLSPSPPRAYVRTTRPTTTHVPTYTPTTQAAPPPLLVLPAQSCLLRPTRSPACSPGALRCSQPRPARACHLFATWTLVARCTFALRGVYACDVNVVYHLDAIQSPSACRTMTGTRQDVEPPQ